MFRKIILSTLVAASFGAASFGALAQRPNYATVAPPAPRSEAVPEPRRGREWSPGHYVWRNGEYRWVRGQWVNARRGQKYEPAHWVERNGRWVMEPGRWITRNDRDGDGVKNRDDRRPNNPNRS